MEMKCFKTTELLLFLQLRLQMRQYGFKLYDKIESESSIYSISNTFLGSERKMIHGFQTFLHLRSKMYGMHSTCCNNTSLRQILSFA